jgi:hypothetical protein
VDIQPPSVGQKQGPNEIAAHSGLRYATVSRRLEEIELEYLWLQDLSPWSLFIVI